MSKLNSVTAVNIVQDCLDRLETLQAQLFGEDLSEDVLDSIYNISIVISHKENSRFFGSMVYETKTLILYPHIHNNSLEEFEDTVKHELAHHVADILYGIDNIKPHGKEWKSLASFFGARPKASHTMEC